MSIASGIAVGILVLLAALVGFLFYRIYRRRSPVEKLRVRVEKSQDKEAELEEIVELLREDKRTKSRTNDLRQKRDTLQEDIAKL